MKYLRAVALATAVMTLAGCGVSTFQQARKNVFSQWVQVNIPEGCQATYGWDSHGLEYIICTDHRVFVR